MPSIFRIMQMVACQMDTSSSGTTSYEDLTTFTLVDPEENAVVDATSITITDLDCFQTDFYMYKDYGAKYFNPNYTIEYELTVTTAPLQDARYFGIIKTAQIYGSGGNSGRGPCSNGGYRSEAPENFEFHSGQAGYAYSHLEQARGVKLYCKTVRSLEGTTGSNITSVYSDSARENIIGVPFGRDDIPIAVIDYNRYFMVGFSGNDAFEEGHLATYKIENVEITENGPAGTVIYTSDFSVGEDGWTAVQAAVAGDIDDIGGQDNNLRFTSNDENNNRWLAKTTTMDSDHDYIISFQYYIPAGQSNIDGIMLQVDEGGAQKDSDDLETLGAWTTVSFGVSAPEDTYLKIYALDGGEQVFTDAGGDDVFYIRNVTIDEF